MIVGFHQCQFCHECKPSSATGVLIGGEFVPSYRRWETCSRGSPFWPKASFTRLLIGSSAPTNQ